MVTVLEVADVITPISGRKEAQRKEGMCQGHRAGI